MRPIPSDQGFSDLALTEVFATKGQVRLLRFLATEADGSVTAVDVSTRIGMTRSGSRKALERLFRCGLVQRADVGNTARYALRREGPLAEEIVRLFQLEHQTHNGNGGGPGMAQGNGNGKSTRDAPPVETEGLNSSSPEFHGALVSLLEEDLSLIRRARENVLKKLKDREPGNGHDLWEWRKVLDTYPLPRLLHFLESDSPRALRLRKSSPFPDVMSEGERERLGGYMERMH
jgi:DNA-binding transcriptional ArsR family regulator